MSKSAVQLLTVVYLLSLAALSGCSTTTTHVITELPPAERAYVAKTLAAPTTFEVDKARSEEVWARANSFVNRYSQMKIQSANEYHLQTQDPSQTGNGTVGYLLTREPNGSKVNFSVKCSTKTFDPKYTAKVCRANEKILAHYMLTGELNDKFIDSVTTESPSFSAPPASASDDRG